MRGPIARVAGVAALALAVPACGSGAKQTHSHAEAGRARGSPAATVLHPLVRTFPAGENPHDLVATGGRVWVADFGGPVREFTTGGRQLRSIGLDEQSLAAGAGALWVGILSNRNTPPLGSLAELNPRSGRVQRRVQTRDAVDLLAVGDGAVWSASRFAPRITRIPLSGGRQRSFRLPGAPSAIALGSGGVWVAYGPAQPGLSGAVGEPSSASGGVVELDPLTGIQLVRRAEPGVPTAVVVAHGTVWVALANGLNEVDRIDAATGQAAGPEVAVGQQPIGLAPGDGSVWALNYSDGTVSRLDPASGRVEATIAFAPRTDPNRLAANSPIRLAMTRGALWITDAEAGILRRLRER